LLAPRLAARPPLGLVLGYLGLARLSLALAFGAIAVDPLAVMGFFYHPRMLAVVHLVTLGWITLSIFGTLYMVGPLAFGMRLPPSARDGWGLALIALGISGLVSHFWIEELSGMAWSAATLTAGLALGASRLLPALRRAGLPRATALPFQLAFANLLAAALLGILIGFDRHAPFLPGASLHRVIGHAHLAALGWATLMVVAAGSRLLPMLLPAAPPAERPLVRGVALFEIGVLALSGGLIAGSRWALAGAVAVGAGLALLGSRVLAMLRRRRPPPPGRRRPVFPIWHVTQALLCLALAALLGLLLAAAPAAAWTLRAILAYGVLGLVGFLAQIVVGVSGYLLPIYSWSRASTDVRFLQAPTSVHDMPSQGCRAAIWALWALGVPALAAGLAADHSGWLRCGAGLLLGAVLLESLDAAWILRHALPRRGAA